MTHFPARRQSAEARAHAAVLAIARFASWSVDRVGLRLDRRYAHYLHSDTAQLLLVPATGSLINSMSAVDSAMRDARSDALIVNVAAQPHSVSIALGIWGQHENEWHAPMRVWQRGDLGAWLVPDPYHSGVRRACFRMVPDHRLIASGKPWRSEAERRHGCNQADANLSRMLRG